MTKGKLFVVSGPSGAGKSTLTKMIVEKIPNLYLTVSATTREARTGEVDGEDYYFISKEVFEEKVKNNEFIEHANVHGNYYGTLAEPVQENLEDGKNVILEIDVQGGAQVKEKFPEAVMIFVKTPNNEILESRLRGRGTDREEIIRRRLKNSLREMEYEKKYDKILINDTIENALAKLAEIIEKRGE